MRKGLFAIGRMTVIIVTAPFTMPDPPMPEILRPMINIVDETETAATRVPTSKTAMKAMNVH